MRQWTMNVPLLAWFLSETFGELQLRHPDHPVVTRTFFVSGAFARAFTEIRFDTTTESDTSHLLARWLYTIHVEDLTTWKISKSWFLEDERGLRETSGLERILHLIRKITKYRNFTIMELLRVCWYSWIILVMKLKGNKSN